MNDTPDTLNHHFGAPGRIAFREGPGGIPVAALIAPHGACELSLLGGQVLSYRPRGFQDVLWLSPLAEFSEGKPIRGGIPICWPWFGKAPAGLPSDAPNHGFARTARWRVIGSEQDTQTTAITLELTDQDATHPAWPTPYRLTLTVTLGDCLTLDLQTRNLVDSAVIYGEALHAYLRVADSRQITLYGLGEKPLVFTDDAAHDIVYPKTDPILALWDPVMERILALAADDASAVVVWHPALAHALPDMPLEGPRHFLCVEPANPHHTGGQITLRPGEAHTLTLRLQATLPPTQKAQP